MSEENKNTEGFGFKVKEEKNTGIMGAQKAEKAEESSDEAAPPVVESTTEETTTEAESSQEVQGDGTDTAPDTDGEGDEDNQV